MENSQRVMNLSVLAGVTLLKSGASGDSKAKFDLNRTESSHSSSNAYGITRGAAYYGRNGKDGDSK